MNEVFPFDISDIVFLLNLKIRRKNQTSWDCDCPFCGKEGKLNINLEKNVFRCNKCGEGGGQLQLYSKVYGLDRATACEQIKNYLGKGIQAPEYESFKKTVKSKPEVIHADRAPDRVLHQTPSTVQPASINRSVSFRKPKTGVLLYPFFWICSMLNPRSKRFFS